MSGALRRRLRFSKYFTLSVIVVKHPLRLSAISVLLVMIVFPIIRDAIDRSVCFLLRGVLIDFWGAAGLFGA